MEEAIVARGSRAAKQKSYKKVLIIIAAVAAALLLIGLISNIANASRAVKNHEHSRYCYKYSYRDDFYRDNRDNDLKDYKMDCEYTNAFGLAMKRYFRGPVLFPILILAGGAIAIGVMRKRDKGYEVIVSEQAIVVQYTDGKTTGIPLESVFSMSKLGEKDLNIVTSENSIVLREMEGIDEVYAAIAARIPEGKVKSLINNEQVLGKGYPPAIKPFLLVLLILIGLASVIGAIASEFIGVFFVGIVPFAIVLLFYLAAKTPYFVVTDKRVFYVSDFGRKLSLPITKLTVVVSHNWFGQLHVAAPTGRIHLFWLKNTAELYDVITALLNEKQ